MNNTAENFSSICTIKADFSNYLSYSLFSCPHSISIPKYRVKNFSCTLHGYYKIWSMEQRDAGNQNFAKQFNYRSWRQSWYQFVKLLDIDHAEGWAFLHYFFLSFDPQLLHFYISMRSLSLYFSRYLYNKINKFAIFRKV